MDRVPTDRPVILAANHPTAFMEPCILACFMDRPLHFLVRGDFFKKPLFAWLLRALNMLPIYRLRDGGYKNLKNNYSTFEDCYKALAAGKTLMILAEGRTIHEKRLRPIRKGTARIALGALEQNPEMDIAIVPVGVNYTYADRFRSEVMIDFGEPIAAREYFEGYKNNPSKAITTLTEELRERLEKSIIIIKKKEDEDICEDLFILNRSERPQPHWPVIQDSSEPLTAEKTIAEEVNGMPAGKKNSLRQNLQHYFNQLQEFRIQDKTVVARADRFSQDGLLLLFGLAPFLVGYLFNYLPLRSARLIADLKVKSVEFHSSVMVAVGIGTYLIYYVIWLAVALILTSWKLLLFIISFPFLGLWALYYLEVFQRFRQSWRWRTLKSQVQSKLATLRGELAIDN